MTMAPTVQELLDQAQARQGFVSNMMKELGKSPAVLDAYLRGQEAMKNGSLRPKEMQVVQLAAVSFFNCTYCKAAHGTILGKFKVAQADIDALRGGGDLSEPELANLARATRMILEKQGALSAEDLAGLEMQGIDRPKLYEIITLIGLKVVTAWVDHVAHLAIDKEYGG